VHASSSRQINDPTASCSCTFQPQRPSSHCPPSGEPRVSANRCTAPPCDTTLASSVQACSCQFPVTGIVACSGRHFLGEPETNCLIFLATSSTKCAAT
jgi:hypothetical protein